MIKYVFEFTVKEWIGYYIASWLDVICGTVNIITFCMYRPWWDFHFRAYWTKRIIHRRMK
jgi:hypothetical protein